MWSFRIFKTITGEPMVDVHPSGGSWLRRFGGVGSGAHTFELADEKANPFTRAQWDELTLHWVRTLVVMWDGKPTYAGLILDDDYDDDTGRVTLEHSELREIYSHRYPFGVSAFADGDLAVTGKSFQGAVRAVVQRASGGSFGATWDLPIDYPADQAGSLSFSWKRYDWLLVEDILKQLETMDGGPDIDFRPVLDENGWLRWQLVVGTTHLPGSTLHLPVTAARRPVTGLRIRRSGSQMLSGVFALGKGTEEDMRFGEAGFLGGPELPTLDAAVSVKDVANQGQLDSIAAATLVQHRTPTKQYSFNLVAEQDADGVEQLDVGALRPGARLRLGFWGHRREPDGWRDTYLVSLRGDMTRTLKPEVQPL